MTVEEALNKYKQQIFSYKQIEFAQRNINKGEDALFAWQGRSARPEAPRNSDVGTFVITEKRVFFCCTQPRFMRVEEIPLKRITGLQIHKRNILDYELTIQGFTQTISLINSQLNIEMVKKVVQLAIDTFAEPSEEEPEADSAKETAPSTDRPSKMEDQLRALKSLLDDGILTQEEFDAKKKQVLGL